MNLILPQAPLGSDKPLQNYAQEVKKTLQGLVEQLGSTSTSTSTADNTSWLYGFKNTSFFNNNASDATNDIDFTSCAVVDSTKKIVIVNNTAITKQLDAAWRAGTNQGGLFSGSKQPNKWYALWAIMKADGTKDYGFDLSSSSPTMPSGFIYKAFIGWIYNQSTNAILPFSKFGDYIEFKSIQIDKANAALANTTRNLQGLTAPPGSIARISPFFSGTADGVYWIASTGFTDVPPTLGGICTANVKLGTYMQQVHDIPVDANRQIAYRGNTTGAYLQINTLGFTLNI